MVPPSGNERKKKKYVKPKQSQYHTKRVNRKTQPKIDKQNMRNVRKALGCNDFTFCDHQIKRLIGCFQRKVFGYLIAIGKANGKCRALASQEL
jgi:hypothetical protein